MNSRDQIDQSTSPETLQSIDFNARGWHEFVYSGARTEVLTACGLDLGIEGFRCRGASSEHAGCFGIPLIVEALSILGPRNVPVFLGASRISV